MGKWYLRQLMSLREMELALSRIAGEIVQDYPTLGDIAMVGILRRGVPLAEILRNRIHQLGGVEVPLGTLDITFYRDDLTLIGPQPVVEASNLNFTVSEKVVILVDDVLYTGRTTRAALESVIDYGRPREVRLSVLIDRGNRELPIQADYVGQYVETDENEVVEVRIPPQDEQAGVFLTTRELLQRET